MHARERELVGLVTRTAGGGGGERNEQTKQKESPSSTAGLVRLLRLLCDKPRLDGGRGTTEGMPRSRPPGPRASATMSEGLSWEGPAGPGWPNPVSLGIQGRKGLTPATNSLGRRRRVCLWFYVGLSHFVQLEALAGAEGGRGEGSKTWNRDSRDWRDGFQG